MAKAADPQTTALTALAQALADPAPRALFGSAKVLGFFKTSSAPTRAAAKLCEDRQWLATTGDFTGSGKSRKPFFRLTPAGVQAVLQNSETLNLLKDLDVSLRQQVELLRAQRDLLGQMVGNLQPLADAVGHLNRIMQPPDVEGILRRLNHSPAVPAAPSAASAPDWLDEVVRLVTEQRQRDRYLPPTLPALYATLKPTRPSLTLGQFHDGLRLLRDQGRLRLSPYTRALATIDDARNALFLDGEVMYYAELP
jgi:hypothetical protein